MSNRTRTLMLVEAAVAIALAFVLDKVTLFKMPQGGSVTAGSMIPILFVALRWGPRTGILAGVAFGLTQLATASSGSTEGGLVQVLLDYPLAFGALGFAGFASGSNAVKTWIGTGVGVLMRTLLHVVSGAIFFGQYAPEGQNPWVYSLIYNGTYLIPELMISAALLMVLLPALNRALPQPEGQVKQSA